MTLAEFLVQKLADAGLTVQDVSLVRWNHPTFGWLPADRATFIATAQRVQAAEVTLDARVRLEFDIVTSAGVERTFAWDPFAGDFVLVPEPPKVYAITADDLTT